MYGPESYPSSDMAELDYAEIARSAGCHGIRVTSPDALAPACAQALACKGAPTVIDVCVTRDPARMLPAADNRALKVDKGDRPV